MQGFPLSNYEELDYPSTASETQRRDRGQESSNMGAEVKLNGGCGNVVIESGIIH